MADRTADRFATELSASCASAAESWSNVRLDTRFRRPRLACQDTGRDDPRIMATQMPDLGKFSVAYRRGPVRARLSFATEEKRLNRLAKTAELVSDVFTTKTYRSTGLPTEE